ncbi:MAG: tape measure protein, partial [Acinetobacter sp.]
MAGNLDFETTLSANTNTFISAFRDATNTIANLGNSADASAQNLEQMSQYGRQHIQSLNLSLAQARAELVHLSATNATPQDIANAQNRIQLLQTAISQTTTVFDAYGAHAQNAMRDAANGADGAGAQLTQLQQEVSTLVGGLDGVRSSLDENGNSATHTRQQLEQMAENATTQLNQYKRQLEQAKLEVNRLAATNASPADIEQARQRVRELETGVEQVETSLDGYRSAARIANNEAASGANRSATAFEQVNTGVNGAKFAVNALVGAMAALGVGLGINELAQAADTYTNLSARINIATKDGGDFTSAMAGVHQVALMTNSSLEATGNLFTKINDTGKEMGMTQQQALDLTKTINQAIQIGGGSAQAGEAALQQFIQALQSGVLRGDEFNSIMEQAPGLTSAMAKGLGVTTGELRKMAENGELGAERITKALQSQAGQIQATYDKFPTTIGNALQRITTSWEILIGKMDQANGASSTVAQWLVVLADNIADLDIILSDVGKGFVWVGDQLKKIDPATIEALKTALASAYDAIKSMASSLGNGLEIAGDQINSVLGAIFEFNSGVDTAADKTNGLTKLLQALNVAFGFINDGFSGIAIAANLLSGAVYAVAGGFVHLKSKILLGDAKDAAIKEFQELIKKSDEYYQRASDGATEFKSKGVEAINEISKTQKQKNDEVVADNTATFAELLAQSTDLNQKSKVLSEERAALDKQLNQARTDGSQSTIDAIIQKSNELEGREKE